LLQLAADIRQKNIRNAGPRKSPEAPSAHQLNRIKENVDRAMQELEAERMMRYGWVMQQGRVERMVAAEQEMGYTHPRGHKDVAALMRIAQRLMKYDLDRSAWRCRVGGDTASINMEKADAPVNRFAVLETGP
jgi:hypothetical protein